MADAFQPKFVDLVRNYSTTVGTGNFVLGPAVNGYAGLASALTAGDRFYYSAIGVDKPTEREVGRGTLLADGSVAREPITGSKTNFTSGTKAIALIAAAEWFARVQSGGGAGVLPAETRLTLAALSDRQSPAILAEAGREGIFLFDRSNLAAKVTADPNQGMFVAPASDASGATGAWVRKFSGKAQASWFGFVVTATAAANFSAINAALATLKAAAPANVYSYPGSVGLEIGEGQFDVGGAIAITHPLELCGQLSGPFGGGGTVLRFIGNTAGINTSASAQGACIHGFNLVGAFAGTNSSTAHGLDLSVKIDAYNLRIEDFAGDGIHGYANGAGANLNNSSFRTIAIFNCRNGSWMEGGDGNASTFDNVSCFSNRQCGHRDKSFIGNVYRGGDVSGNGNHPAFATRCIQAGNCYAVALDQEVWCSTNPPSGTTAHNQGWVYLGSAGIAAVTRTLGIEGHSGEVAGALSAAALDATDLGLGRWDGANVALQAVDWADANGSPLGLLNGAVGTVSIDGEQFSADLTGATARLDEPVCPATSPECRANFGDKQCRVDLAGRSIVTFVTSASGAELILDRVIDDRYLLGRLHYLSGAIAAWRAS